MCNQTLKRFRVLTGPARRIAMVHYLQAHGVVFGQDVHAVPVSTLTACAELAKAVCWRKSLSSSMSIGAAFYLYLSKAVAPAVPARRMSATPGRGAGIVYGRGYAA